MKKFAAYCMPFLLGSLLTFSLGSCNRNKKETGTLDTPTSGAIKISADESFQPIVEAQLSVFHRNYKNAKITASYKPEGQVVQDLLQDSARVIIVSRPLTPSELKVFEKAKITPRITPIAYDGVALILHPDNRDTLLSLPQLHEIFTGKASSWKQVNPASALGDITIVFDNNNSGTARFMQDSVAGKQPLTQKAYASQSSPAVIDYVAQNKNAIGVIGTNWISDFDDSTVVGFINRIKVVAVGRKTAPNDPDSYYQPYQAYLVQGNYPLRREVYTISREPRAGLGTGFVSFVSGDKGQRIMLKAGLAPARGVVRLVEVKK